MIRSAALVAALLACLAAAADEVPRAGVDYYSVQVISGPRETLLRAQSELKSYPYARIERRGDQFVLFVGFWESREAALEALGRIRLKSPQAFVRVATYRPADIVAMDEAPDTATPAVPASTGERQTGGIAAPRKAPGTMSLHDKPPANVLYLVERAPTPQTRRTPPPAQIVRPPEAEPVAQVPQPADPGSAGAESPLAAAPRAKPAARSARTPEETLREQIDDAVRRRDDATLARLAIAHASAFACDRVDVAWTAMEALANTGAATEAQALALALVDTCAREEDRLATLYKAKPRSSPAAWRQLLDREAGRARSAAGEAQFAKLTYDDGMERWLEAHRKQDPAALALLAELAPRIEENRDGAAALLAGWQHYQGAALDAATRWFARALEWGAPPEDALRGLALSARASGRLEEAQGFAARLPADDGERAGLLRDILLARAQRETDAARVADAAGLYEQAAALAPLPRHARSAWAWALLSAGDTGKAAALFEALYRELPDDESASGVLASHRGEDRRATLELLADSEPLRARLREERGREAYSRKRFLAAARQDPQRHGAWGTPSSGVVEATGAERTRTGSPGLGRLRLTHGPALGFAWTSGEAREFRFRLDAVTLSSGALPANSCVGSACSGTYAFTPVVSMRGLQPRFFFRDESERSETRGFELGITPEGGAVPARPFGRAFRQAETEWGRVSGALFADPVRDSMLSYVGLRDPYRGEAWGRVMRYGTELGALHFARAPWSYGGTLRAEYLSGTGVSSNARITASASAGRDLSLAGFDYAVLGLNVTLDRYARNLSAFTQGSGGYFSPQRYVRIGPALDFLTEEGKPLILRGRFSAGRAYKRESAQRSVGDESGAELAAAWNVSPSLQANLSWVRSNAPQYAETLFGLGIRVFFEPRRGALSTDLPRTGDLR